MCLCQSQVSNLSLSSFPWHYPLVTTVCFLHLFLFCKVHLYIFFFFFRFSILLLNFSLINYTLLKSLPWPHTLTTWFILNVMPKLDTLKTGEEQKPKEAIKCLKWHMSTLCICVFSRQVMADSLLPRVLLPARLLCPWEFSGKNTGVGYHFLLQGIFPTQGSNAHLLPCRQIFFFLITETPGMPVYLTLGDSGYRGKLTQYRAQM